MCAESNSVPRCVTLGGWTLLGTHDMKKVAEGDVDGGSLIKGVGHDRDVD